MFPKHFIRPFLLSLVLCLPVWAASDTAESEKVESEVNELENKVEAMEKRDESDTAPAPKTASPAPAVATPAPTPVPSAPPAAPAENAAAADDGENPLAKKRKAAPPKAGTKELEPGASEEAPVSSAKFDSHTIMQVVPTKSFVEFSELDPLPADTIRWDKNSGKFLYISKVEPPFIFLFGSIRAGYEVSINNRWVAVRKGRFEIKLSLPLEPSQFTMKIFSPDRQMQLYRLAYSWTKFPPALRFRVKEEEKVIERAWGYSGRYSRSGWIQLYSNNNPVPVVDLDSIRQANLTFRIYYPPEAEDLYDGYAIIMTNSKGEVVGEYKKLGSPPPFVDWRDISPRVFEADSYQYRIDLFRGEYVFSGKSNRFDTVESYTLINHRYRRTLEFEPREEIGYFSWTNSLKQDYEGLYVGADLPAALWNQFLLRGTLLASLHSLDESNVLSFLRMGAGVRIFGGGHNDLIGKPYLFRLDVYLNLTNFTVKPYTTINLFTHPSVLVEPHFLLWNYHYIVPWIEYGARLRREEERLSFGLGYFFYIRPWSIKLGIGFSSDRILRFDIDPNLRFQVFRTWTSLTYIL